MRCVKTRARFTLVVVMMAMDPTAINSCQVDKKLQKSMTLHLRASVCRLAIRIQAANIGHTDTVRIVALTMRPRLTDRPSTLYSSVKPDNIVIADRLPTSLLVPSRDVGSRKILTGSGSRTVDDYVIYVSRHDDRLKPRVDVRLFNVRKGTNFN